MSSSITQLTPLLPGEVNGQYDVIPIVSVGEIAPNGSMGVTHKITVENLAYVIGSNINPEIIMDTVAAHLVGGTGIAIVYDDLNDLLTISNTYTPPVGLLKVQNPLSTTLQVVQDGNNTNSQLYLATDKTQVQGTLQITTANNQYLDAEDSSGNNRFTIGRDPSSQQVNVDFASNPTGSTTTVGAIRTYQDGTNLSEVVKFREDGQVTFSERVIVEADSLVPTQTSSVIQAGTTNANLVIAPNGTGALVAQIPDGGTTGGVARGTNSVDFQSSRTDPNQVASGIRSVVLGGVKNQASGQYSIAHGENNQATDVGSIAIGLGNTATARGAVALGGFNIGNDATGVVSSVTGGDLNVASGNYSVISGGQSNTASSQHSTVSGGQSNTASTGTHATISGGQSNIASGAFSLIAGGASNTANGACSIVGGGCTNVASGGFSGVMAGQNNCARVGHSFVGGGLSNCALACLSSIVGGQANNIRDISSWGFIGGGGSNCIGPNYYSFVGGGQSNRNLGEKSVIVGGFNNYISGNGCLSFIGSGQSNSVETNSGVVSGCSNIACDCSIVGGGISNRACGLTSSVLGGCNNCATGVFSMIGGGCGNYAASYGSTISGGAGNCVWNPSTGNYSLFSYQTVGGGLCNKAEANGSIIAGGLCNCVNAYAYWGSILGSGNYVGTSDGTSAIGAGNNVNSVFGSAVGARNTVSGYGSFILGHSGSATATSTVVLGAYGIANHQNQFTVGKYITYLTPYADGINIVSGGTFDLSLDGTGVTNLIIPGASTPTSAWHIRVDYVASITSITGTATGVSITDTKAQSQQIAVRKSSSGSLLNILSGSPVSDIPMEDPSMSSAQMTYSVGPSQNIKTTFTAPTFAGGGTVNIKVVAKFSITYIR